MKIAVLYIGEQRTLDDTLYYTNKNILLNENVHVFATVDTHTKEHCSILLNTFMGEHLKSLQFFEKVNWIDKMKKIIENIDFGTDTYPYDVKNYLLNSGSIIEYIQLYMSYIKMIEYENKNGKYDYVIKLRTDSIITKSVDFKWLTDPGIQTESLSDYMNNILRKSRDPKLNRGVSYYHGVKTLPESLQLTDDFVKSGDYILSVRSNWFFIIKRSHFDDLPVRILENYGKRKSFNDKYFWNAENVLLNTFADLNIPLFDSVSIIEDESVYNYDQDNYFDKEGKLKFENNLFCFLLRKPISTMINLINNLYDKLREYRYKNPSDIECINIYNTLKQYQTNGISHDIFEYKLDYEYYIIAYYHGIKDVNKVFFKIIDNCNIQSINNNVLNNFKFYINNIKSDNVINISEKISAFDQTFFSSSATIIKDIDGYIINCRYVNYTYDKKSNGIIFAPNSRNITLNKMMYLNSEFKIKKEKIFDIDHSDGIFHIGIEDLRLFNYKGKILFNGCGQFRDGSIGIKIGHYDVNKNILVCDEIQSPYNNNCEKNWVYTEYNNELCMIYKWGPLEIGKVIDKKLKIIETKNMPNIFNYIRGSSNACEYNNELWFVCHIVAPDKDYYHLFVVFNKEMNLLRYSIPFKYSGQRVEYCIGLNVDKDCVIMTYSTWDSSTYIVSVNKQLITMYNYLKTVNIV